MHGQDFQITELDRFLNYKFRSIDRKHSDFQGDSLSTYASKSTMAHRLLKIGLQVSSPCLKVFRGKSSPFRQASKHLGANFFAIVKRKHNVRPAVPRQYPVRAGCSFDYPADAKKSGKNTRSAGGSPPAHAAMKDTFRNSSGRASPCSRRSAITRSAKACTAARASARV